MLFFGLHFIGVPDVVVCSFNCANTQSDWHLLYSLLHISYSSVLLPAFNNVGSSIIMVVIIPFSIVSSYGNTIGSFDLNIDLYLFGMSSVI